MKQEAFEIRTYGKSELAMMYYPEASPENAMNNLRHELKLNPRLRRLINRNRKFYFPKDIRQIIAELGEPSQYQ